MPPKARSVSMMDERHDLLVNGFKYYYGGVYSQIDNCHHLITLLSANGADDQDGVISTLSEVHDFLQSVAKAGNLDRKYYDSKEVVCQLG